MKFELITDGEMRFNQVSYKPLTEAIRKLEIGQALEIELDEPDKKMSYKLRNRGVYYKIGLKFRCCDKNGIRWFVLRTS